MEPQSRSSVEPAARGWYEGGVIVLRRLVVTLVVVAALAAPAWGADAQRPPGCAEAPADLQRSAEDPATDCPIPARGAATSSPWGVALQEPPPEEPPPDEPPPDEPPPYEPEPEDPAPYEPPPYEPPPYEPEPEDPAPYEPPPYEPPPYEPEPEDPAPYEPPPYEPEPEDPAPYEPPPYEPEPHHPAPYEPPPYEPPPYEPPPERSQPERSQPERSQPAEPGPGQTGRQDPPPPSAAPVEPPPADAPPSAGPPSAGPPSEGPPSEDVPSEDAPAEAAPAEDPDEGAPDPRLFADYNLATLGAPGAVFWVNRVGAIVGVQSLGEVAYLAIRPHFNYETTFAEVWQFSLSLDVPLRIEIHDARSDRGFSNAGRFRTEDWDELSDYLQVLHDVRLGAKGVTPFWARIDAFRATTLGYGSVVRHYNPNLAVDTSRTQVEVGAAASFGSVVAYLDSLTGPRVLGGRATVTPFFYIPVPVLETLSAGVHAFADVDAPVRGILDIDDVDDDGRRYNELEANLDTGAPRYVPGAIVAYGASIETVFYRTPRLSLEAWADMSILESGLPTDSGKHDPPNTHNIPTRAVRASGLTVGARGRFIHGDRWPHALHARLEYRTYEPGYQPGYFDELYDVERVQYRPPRTSAGTGVSLADRTKLQSILGRTGPQVQGGYVEVGWRWMDRVAVLFALDLADTQPDNAMTVHLEVPRLGPWTLLATWQRRGAASLGALFTDGFGAGDLFTLQTRLEAMEWLHFSLEVTTPFATLDRGTTSSLLRVDFNIELGIPYL